MVSEVQLTSSSIQAKLVEFLLSSLAGIGYLSLCPSAKEHGDILASAGQDIDKILHKVRSVPVNDTQIEGL